jgi:hypothetical protein
MLAALRAAPPRVISLNTDGASTVRFELIINFRRNKRTHIVWIIFVNSCIIYYITLQKQSYFFIAECYKFYP